MGSVGTSISNTSVVGKDITALSRYTDWKEGPANLRKDFGLDFATTSQITAIRDIFKGMEKFDRSYDDGKTPFIITKIDIRRVIEEPDEKEKALRKSLGMREDKTIQISIHSEPQTESAIIRNMDTKYRSALIGAKGGYYTYDDKSRRKNIKPFDIQYGRKGAY